MDMSSGSWKLKISSHIRRLTFLGWNLFFLAMKKKRIHSLKKFIWRPKKNSYWIFTVLVCLTKWVEWLIWEKKKDSPNSHKKNIADEGCVYSDSVQKEMEKWRSFSSFASKWIYPYKIVLISKMFLSSKHCQILQKKAYNEVTEKFNRGGNQCKNSG